MIGGIVATGVALWLATFIVPNFSFDGEFVDFALLTVILAAANLIIRPILNLLSLPAILLTLGLFMLVVSAAVLEFVIWLAEPERLDLGLTSGNFGWTLLAALVIAIVDGPIDRILSGDD